MLWRLSILALTFVAAGSVNGSDDKAPAPAKKGPVTLHVLDTSLGKPAVGVGVTLERQTDAGWGEVRKGRTDENGRVGDLWPDGKRLEVGVYRLTFETGAYFRGEGRKTFFPRVEVIFEVDDPGGHYHVPLLISPFGYSTYRGN